MTGPGDERRFRRRRFVAGAAAGAAALALPAWLRPSGDGPGLSAALASARPRPFKRKLPIPRELTDADLTIPIKKANIELLPGKKTEMWTYGGTFPGPTIRRPAGETTNVTFKHNLPSKAGELSVHLHGAHNRQADDGQPGGLTAAQPRSAYCRITPGLSDRRSGNDLLIGPGEERTYSYEFVEDGAPERGATHWYHDHRLDRTGENVWRGLAGMWITEDETDLALPVPRGARDLPLLICDKALDSKNRLQDPFGKLKPPLDGATGKTILVNGAYLPFTNVKPLRYRLRILNASNFRPYNFSLTKGVRMWQIATEAGLMPSAIERDEVLLGPGERVELIVDFAEARGEKVELRSTKRSGGAPSGPGSKAYEGKVMQFRVSNETLVDETSPADELDLPPLPSWTQDVVIPPNPFTWSVSISGIGGGSKWRINGRTFDPAFAETTVEHGDVVVWKLQNGSQYAHVMHLHHTDFLVLERNGDPPPPHENCLKETFFMDPFEQLVVAGKISAGPPGNEADYTGNYVVHCHMLDHEDHGLMSQFNVVEATR